MAIWQDILIHIVGTAITVLMVLAAFYRFVLRPYIDRKVDELKAAGDGVERRVRQGVKEGVREGLMDLPESTFKESTRTFLKFGSGLVENGLSSFLSSFDDPERPGSRPDSARNGQP